MLKCTKCGYDDVFTEAKCPECNTVIQLTADEIAELLAEASSAMKHREFETAVLNYKILADLEVTEAEREFARILERGELIERNLDGAMHYFYKAALKNDPYSAYRYSKLASRTSDASARFWLTYSAILGCRDAYLELAALTVSDGNDTEANYYYYLAAAMDDTDAIVTLAKRYYDGIGTEQSSEYAKWYMDKLTLPPIHAIKLAYKLRGVKAKEPPVPEANKTHRLKNLAANAKAYGFDTAYLHLNEMLKDGGDMEAAAILGRLYAEGKGTPQNTNAAIEALHLAAASGIADAYKYLGDMYLVGIGVEPNGETALGYYKGAAEHGMHNAYELMGDMYENGEYLDRNPARAVELYDLAAKGGSQSAKEKSDEIKRERLALYNEAVEKRETEPEVAFRSAAISVAMGYAPSFSLLAEYFLFGIGTKVDRGRAFYWYSEAVKRGDEDALFYLGACHSRGVGTPLDYTKAKEILTRSARCGNEDAARELDRMNRSKMKKLSKQLYSTATRLLYQKKFEPAKRLLDVCAELNNPRAIYTLGCLYEFGMGVGTDRDLAFELYEKSYALKFRDPRQVYKLRILRMVK